MNLKKRFPSYQMVLAGASSSAARFPLTLLCAITGAVMSVWIADDESFKGLELQKRILLCVSLGLPLFLALQTFNERIRWSTFSNLALKTLGIIALAFYYLSLPDGAIESEALMLRHALLAIGAHLLVAWLPFVGASGVNGFWQYNKTLFLRFLVAALYAGALYAGLAIALGSAEHLFDLEVKGIRYFQLWIIIATVFHPWFFLSGVPDDFEKLERSEEFPKGLKIFAQFILLPLVGLYLGILYAYEAKIIIQWNWPRGWVSELILWYAVVGILSLLLLHPLRKKTENLWINIFSKWYFLALVPLVTMLALAIYRRVSEYGITEPRYLVCAMALGLSVVVLYFIFSKTKDIRVIPIVLCILAFGSTYGPLSASSVSLKSQQGRLDALLIETRVLKDEGQSQPAEPINQDQLRQLSNISDYLAEWHGAKAFEFWLDSAACARIDTVSRHTKGRAFAREIGFDHIPKYGARRTTVPYQTWYEVTAQERAWMDVTGYDVVIPDISLPRGMSGKDYQLRENVMLVEYKSNPLALEFEIRQNHVDSIGGGILDLEKIVRELMSSGPAPVKTPDELTYPIRIGKFQGHFAFSRIKAFETAGEITEIELSGTLFLSDVQ